MSAKKKWTIAIIIMLSVGLIVTGGIYAVFFVDKILNPEEKETLEYAPPPSPKQGQTRSGLGMLRTQDNAKVDQVLQEALKPEIIVAEKDVIDVMHHMTHQKVKAKEKWTSVEMTPERVRLLIQMIEAKGTGWVNHNKMIGIARKWENGDFSKVDEDHNFFWRVENGSIGKATGILSEKEELQFIKETFKH